MAPEIKGVLCNLVDSRCNVINCRATQEGVRLGDTLSENLKFETRFTPVYDETGSRPVKSVCQIAGHHAQPLLVYPKNSII